MKGAKPELGPVLFLVLLVWALASGKVMAEGWILPGEERFQINGGAFFAAFDTNLNIDSKVLGEGTDIDLEDDLAFDEETYTYFLDGYWRFAKHHRLFAGYFVFDRDASAEAKDDLQIGDEIYPAGAGIQSEFTLQIAPLAYGYSFTNNEKHELSGIIGFHWAEMDFGVRGYAFAGSDTLIGQTSAKAGAPLPMLGFSYEYRFSRRWTAGGNIQAFYLDLSDSTFAFSGSLLSIGVKTEYWLMKNFGVGAALTYFNLDVDVEDTDWKGELDYQYFGPQIYLSLRF